MSTCPRRTTIQVLAKGFRVSERSEEFQRVVPADSSDLAEEEGTVASQDWPAVLGKLYKLDEAVSREFVLLLRDSSYSLALVAPSRDRHQRRSVVIVVGTTRTDWSSGDIELSLGETASLVRRLTIQTSRSLDGAPDHIQRQLKNNTFFEKRDFDIEELPAESTLDWGKLGAEVRRWRGIAGVSSFTLLPIGANVGCSWEDSTDTAAASESRLDGIFLVKSAAIQPLTSAISLWREPVVESPQHSDSGKIDRALEEVRNEQRELRRIAHSIQAEQVKSTTLLQLIIDTIRSWTSGGSTRYEDDNSTGDK